MKYLSLFTGIGSESVAWKPLGWECLAHCEVDNHASAVLTHHYPNTPNLGDITQVEWSKYQREVDLMIGGSPCQDFSIAGLRKGLKGDRGNLTLEYVNAVRTVKPRFFLWENVPGVLIDKANAFGTMLAGLLGEDSPILPPESGRWGRAGFFISQECSIAYRVLDSQFFGVPQRRRRVFLVGLNFRDCGGLYTAHWGNLSALAGIPAAILFEPESQTGNIEESKSSGEETASELKIGTESVVYRIGSYQSNSMKSDNPHTGIYQTSIATTLQTHGNNPSGHQGGDLICFSSNRSGEDCGLIAPTLRKGGSLKKHENAGCPPAITKCLLASNYQKNNDEDNYIIESQYEVRRLTPVECERLQGFPDGYTAVIYKGKPMSKGPRYRMLGNAVTTNVLAWLGDRIEFVKNNILQEA